MRKLIAIGGLPASGKTSLMKKFMEGKKLVKQEPEKLLTSMYDAKYDLHILGDWSGEEVEDYIGSDYSKEEFQEFEKNGFGELVNRGGDWYFYQWDSTRNKLIRRKLGQFPGTDRLSMAVQPPAIEFLKGTKSNILFEGDRLFTASFLEEAVNLVDVGLLDLKILIINADPSLIEKRHKDRADSQTEKFLKGRATKYENIQSSFLLMSYIEVMNNNTPEDLIKIVNWLRVELHERDEVVELL